MIIGAMNHPMQDIATEIRRFAGLGFDFVDLTLEPIRAGPDTIDPSVVASVLEETNLGVVGHTAYYLPIGSPFDRLQAAAIDELTSCFDIFARLKVKFVNVHPDPRVPSLFPNAWAIQRNLDSLARLVVLAEERGLRLMLENIPGMFNEIASLQLIFAALPSLGWHLDVGHANLGAAKNSTALLLEQFGGRLCHVHFSDNKGGDLDLHLPLGAGTIDWRWAIRQLKHHGYDSTITLEVFSPDSDYLAMSRRKLRALWDE